MAVNLLARMAACALLAGVGGAGCERVPGAEPPIIGRPAVTTAGPLRLAFTARGRVWVIEQVDAPRPGSGAAVALALPGDGHQDRPVWLPGGEALAMSCWYGGQADLAVYAGGTVHRVTSTPASELLDDVAPDGRFLFERDGLLFEMTVTQPPPDRRNGRSWQTGSGRFLVRGRDGRYTADGRRILFVRGLEREPLGIWRQGYAGGDDSEIYLLDLGTRAVARLTDNPNNDEMPLPLDSAGRRFIACQERGGPYRPWLVQILTPHLQRVHRFPSPGGDWPALFPALRRGAQADQIELWYEADGRLFRTAGAVRDTGLAFAPAEEISFRLERPAAISSSSLSSRFGRALFRQVAERLAANEFVAERWHAIPRRTRRRFAREMTQAASSEAAEEILARLLGRLGLSGLYYLPKGPGSEPGIALPGGGRPPPPGSSPVAGELEAEQRLGRALREAGMAYLVVPRLVPDLASALDSLRLASSSAIVLDLRRTWGGWGADSLLARLCGSAGGGDGRALAPQPQVIALLSGETYGEPEIFAEGLRALGCGTLVGRPTAGAAVATELHLLPVGGALVMPLGPVERPGGGLFDGRGVVPDLAVPERADPSAEPWLEALLAVE